MYNQVSYSGRPTYAPPPQNTRVNYMQPNTMMSQQQMQKSTSVNTPGGEKIVYIRKPDIRVVEIPGQVQYVHTPPVQVVENPEDELDIHFVSPSQYNPMNQTIQYQPNPYPPMQYPTSYNPRTQVQYAQPNVTHVIHSPYPGQSYSVRL